MSNDPVELQCQLEAFTAENERLREFNDLLRAQRKELMDQLYGPAEKHAVTDEEIAAALKDPNRVSFRKMLADLGIPATAGTDSVPSPAWRSAGLDDRTASQDPVELRRQVEQLQAENAWLREANDYLRGQRKMYSDTLYADLDALAPTDEEIAAAMKDPNRMSLGQLLADLGIK